jgi:hypothetical protein
VGVMRSTATPSAPRIVNISLALHTVRKSTDGRTEPVNPRLPHLMLFCNSAELPVA